MVSEVPMWASSATLAVTGRAQLKTGLWNPMQGSARWVRQLFQMKSINNQNSLAIPKFIWLHYFQAFPIKLEKEWEETVIDNMKESVFVPQNDQIDTH